MAKKENKTKEGKQSTFEQIENSMRQAIDSYHYERDAKMLAMFRSYTSRTSPRPQEQKQSPKIRSKELNTPLPQMPHGSTPQRKLLRLKDNPNKRKGMEQLHTKSKAGKRKNRQKLLRKNLSKT